jgi:hypothetical protein
MFRQDPGPCPVCGAAHSACTGDTGQAILIPQLPARDAAGRLVLRATPQAEAVQATLPPGSFTTATYRGKKGR